MKLQGLVDNLDGLTIRREACWAGWSLRIFDPDDRDRVVIVSVPHKMFGNVKDLDPNCTYRVSIEKVDEKGAP